MLKLMALDEEDLGVFSFHLHNARLYVRDMLRQEQGRNFVLALRRFDWEAAITEAEGGQAAGAGAESEGKKSAKALLSARSRALKEKKARPGKAAKAPPKPGAATKAAAMGTEQIAAIVQFDHVLAVRSYGIDRRQGEQVLSLKGLCFRPRQAPGGIITFLFAEKAGLELKVECIEARLQDLPATGG